MGIEWRSGWTADEPLDFSYNSSARQGNEWSPFNDRGGIKRDLGLHKASNGLILGTHFRYEGSGAGEPTDWRCHDLDFQFVYVLNGSAKLHTVDAVYDLSPEATFTQPAFTRYKLTDISPDFETLEIVGPGDFRTFWGEGSDLPPEAVQWEGAKGHYSMARDAEYVAAAGPRPYFRYRDLGTAEPTDGRIYIHSVKMIPPPKPGGTGWHKHSMRQWVYVLGGNAQVDLKVDDGIDELRVSTGDWMTLHSGQLHDVPYWTDDYRAMEICIPKEYSTTPVAEPAKDAS